MPDEQPRGPYELAQSCRAKVSELDDAIAAAPTERERKALRKRRKLCRDMAKWCETRRGYVEPVKGKA